MVQGRGKGSPSSGRSNGNGKKDRRLEKGRRDEAQNRRKEDRRKESRRQGDRRRMKRRETHCPVCEQPLTQTDFCKKCNARMIRIRSRS